MPSRNRQTPQVNGKELSHAAACAVFAVWGMSAFSWTPQVSNTTASLRGLHAVSAQIAWASGTHGTYLVTQDGGLHWRAGAVAGAESLDFRDVEAFDGRTAYLLCSGEGSQSRVYKTTDGGEHWKLLFTNPDAKGFFDALSFWDRRNGILVGDPVNGQFVIFTTADGGESWQRQQGPAALPNEGAFAASGTCLTVQPGAYAWFGTGGPGAARVFRSTDGGHSWAASKTAIRKDSKSAGIFSLAFMDALHGEAVGGDYQKPAEDASNTAMTSDGGRTWISPPRSAARGYRSAVVFVPKQADTLIAVGMSGSDVSRDRGQSWDLFSKESFNAVSAAPDGSVWAAGANGAIARLTVKLQ
jgi:photosystem II stability/assembly factor-like uncharacterized protein